MTQLTHRYGEALALAHRLHEGQTRKSGSVPYISHPLAVSGLVLEYGGDEDESIAGLLHDTVEDCGGKPVLEQIQRHFGARVAGIVDGCTDTYEDPKPEWRARKEAFIERLKKADRSVLQVVACDKLHNVRCLIQDYRREGEPFWNHAWRGYEDSLWYYRSASAAIAGRLCGPAGWELARSIGEFKHLVEDVRQHRRDQLASNPNPGMGMGEGFGCKSCWPLDAETAWEARTRLAHYVELIDESHFHVMILGCPHCAQRFVSVFTEIIDWKDGDDPQYWTLLPVTAEEADNLVRQRESLAESDLDALGPGRRSLSFDSPKGFARNVYWSTGIQVGMHD